jgi:2-dehydro-3-deoxyphosphogluconate aldolase/(4S)-4-hydroxy-2-oxoglutarate aldolase
MNPSEAILCIRRTRILAILRGPIEGHEIELVEALVAGGITAAEVSTVTPGYAAIIGRLSAHFAERAAIGAGTVTTPAELKATADAGASFIVSPGTDPAIIHQTRELGLASFPGALTPTEVMLAAESGADAVKIFPAASLGPSYIRALRGPFPNIPLVPTGGIHLENLRAYLDAGAIAVGIGSELIGKTEFENFNAAALTQKARAYAAAARESNHA